MSVDTRIAPDSTKRVFFFIPAGDCDFTLPETFLCGVDLRYFNACVRCLAVFGLTRYSAGIVIVVFSPNATRFRLLRTRGLHSNADAKVTRSATGLDLPPGVAHSFFVESMFMSCVFKSASENARW